ncbi:MAG: SufD family Fe-S cluster assembly protein [Pseudomonadota bacterium]
MVSDASRKAAEGLIAALPQPAGEAGWVRDVRAAARTRLFEAGAPHRRDEYWRFTDPARLVAPQSAPVVDAGEVAADHGGDGIDAFPGIDAHRIGFVNGVLRPDLSAHARLDGVAIASLADVLTQDITIARELFGKLELAGQEKVLRPLAMLNTAAARAGVVLQVTGTVATPIHLGYRQIGEGAAVLRHVVRVESGGDLTLIESGHAANSLIEVDVAPGGTFRHLRVSLGDKTPTVAQIFGRVGEGATFKSFTLTADGSLMRNETVIDLVGDDAVGHVAGAVLGRGGDHIDNTVFVTHSALRGESRQVFKNVLTETSTAVFQGKIFVRQPAQKTDGYQISQSVVLDDGAEFLVKPELEIYADDVKCSHGSTTGALDPDGLFYLMARGIPRRLAEAMLIEAFADEAIEEIDDPAMADAMRGHVSAWMAERA